MTHTKKQLLNDIKKVNGVRLMSEYTNANIIVSIAQIHFGIESTGANFVNEVGAVVRLSQRWN